MYLFRIYGKIIGDVLWEECRGFILFTGFTRASCPFGKYNKASYAYVGVAQATQWLPSGHDEDQSCRAGQVGTMRDIWAPQQAPGPGSASFMQDYLQSLICQVDGREEDRLPDVIRPQRDLQLPQNFGRLLNPPAKLLQEMFSL